MHILLGHILYYTCAGIAGLFLLGGVIAMLFGLGESPLAAAIMFAVLALLTYGFGWGGRHVLKGKVH